jgi:hypothetical protein
MNGTNIDLSISDEETLGPGTGSKKKKAKQKSNSEIQEDKTPPKKSNKNVIEKEHSLSPTQQRKEGKCLVSIILDSVYAASVEGIVIKESLISKDLKVFESTSTLQENVNRSDPTAPFFPVNLLAYLIYHYCNFDNYYYDKIIWKRILMIIMISYIRMYVLYGVEHIDSNRQTLVSSSN